MGKHCYEELRWKSRWLTKSYRFIYWTNSYIFVTIIEYIELSLNYLLYFSCPPSSARERYIRNESVFFNSLILGLGNDMPIFYLVRLLDIRFSLDLLTAVLIKNCVSYYDLHKHSLFVYCRALNIYHYCDLYELILTRSSNSDDIHLNIELCHEAQVVA